MQTKLRYSLLMAMTLLAVSSCRQTTEREVGGYKYIDVSEADTTQKPVLYAVTDEEFLEYGSRVAYVNSSGDTVIPFGNYAYFGTDSFVYYANVLELHNDSIYGRQIAINRNKDILFDLVMFDNGPEPFNEGLTRVLRNGKMGYANKYGRVVIPCIYDYAKWFKDGKAKVTFEAVMYKDMDDHQRVESDEWFEIDNKGNRIKKATE